MPQIARIGDPFTCGDTVKSGSANVYANGIPVGRLSDATIGDPCGAPSTIINKGSGTVFVNGLPIARIGDSLRPHSCPSSSPHGGTISGGSPNVKADG